MKRLGAISRPSTREVLPGAYRADAIQHDLDNLGIRVGLGPVEGNRLGEGKLLGWLGAALMG